MVEENRQLKHGEEKYSNPIEELEEIIQKRIQQKTEKAKVWRKVFEEFRDWILQSLERGISKADIHYALNEYVKKNYGKQYLIKANYFYALFKEYFGSIETPKGKQKAVSLSTSEIKTKSESKKETPAKPQPVEETDQTKKPKRTSIGEDLDEFNRGGVI